MRGIGRASVYMIIIRMRSKRGTPYPVSGAVAPYGSGVGGAVYRAWTVYGKGAEYGAGAIGAVYGARVGAGYGAGVTLTTKPTTKRFVKTKQRF